MSEDWVNQTQPVYRLDILVGMAGTGLVQIALLCAAAVCCVAVLALVVFAIVRPTKRKDE